MATFSKRHGYVQEVEITIREDAPDGLRCFIIDIAEDNCNLSPSTLRTIICRVLHESPNSSNWSNYPNIDEEIRWLIGNCEWHKVYDIIERLYVHLVNNLPIGGAGFATPLLTFLRGLSEMVILMMQNYIVNYRSFPHGTNY